MSRSAAEIVIHNCDAAIPQPPAVIPAKAGIPWHQTLGDPRLRGDDSDYAFFDTSHLAFYPLLD